MEVDERLEHTSPESGHGVLDTGAQTEHALEVRLFQQELPVRRELVRSAQEGCDAVDKLRYQACVRVICLAVVIRNHLENKEERGKHMKATWLTLLTGEKHVRLLGEECMLLALATNNMQSRLTGI